MENQNVLFVSLKGLLFMKSERNMVQKVNQKFIFSFLLTDVIKENEDFLRKVQKNTENFNSTIFKTKIGRLIMQSKRANCGIKKPRFVKEQEAKGLLSNL